MFQLIVFAAFCAAANAGYLAAPAVGYAAAHSYTPPAVTSQSANILRSYGNLGQVSTYTKTVDTPYSSVSKSDIRVSNPGYTTYAAPAYHAPAYAAYHAPAVAAYHAPAYTTYHAPAYTSYHAPAVAAPVVARHAYAPAALGVSYSAAPAVAHYAFDGFGTHLAW